MQVNILEAENRLSQLIKSVQAGEEVVIANRGEPVARLVPAHGLAKTAEGIGSAQAILGWVKSSPSRLRAALGGRDRRGDRGGKHFWE